MIIAILDFIIGNTLRHFYFRQVAGADYRTAYSMDSTTAEILIFGSSRANHHYVPEVFEDNLKMSFYNNGRDGNFLLYNYAVFKAVVRRYTPRIIVFDINQDDFFFGISSYERLSSLLPYYRSHDEIKSIINLKSPFEKIKLISSIYPFNSKIITIGIGNLSINKDRKGDDMGFVPLKQSIADTTLVKLEHKDGSIDDIKINALKDILQICKSKKIQIILIQLPLYGYVEENKSLEVINNLATEYNKEFWNYANDPYFIKNPTLFQDLYHLNEQGALQFSQMVVDRIMKENIN